jgi:Group II intron, maturase-specific domain
VYSLSGNAAPDARPPAKPPSIVSGFGSGRLCNIARESYYESLGFVTKEVACRYVDWSQVPRRFKHRIREVTLRAKGVSLETTIAELASYLRGWRSYFGFCETPHVLIQLTRWVRLRLRAAMWRQWKTPRRRRAALLELGVRPRLASNTAGSGLGPWYLARAKALSVGLSNAHFKSLGLPTLIDGC